MKMKKLTGVICAAAVTLGMMTSVFANPSISTVSYDPESVTAEAQDSIPDGMKVEVQEPDTTRYGNKETAEVVDSLNSEDKKITMEEAMDKLNVDPAKVKTENTDKEINPLDYDFITKFADLVLTDGTNVKYDNDGNAVSAKVTFKAEAAKGAKAENLLIMQIDPKNGKVYFIEILPEDFDPETGEITVTFPCLGPFTILEKTQADA